MIRRFVLVLGAMAIGLSGCASAYRNAPVVAEDLIVEHSVIIWTNEGATLRGVIAIVEDTKLLLALPDGRREWIMFDSIRTLKLVSEDRQTPWGVKLALWTLGVYIVLGLALSQLEWYGDQ